MLEQQLVWRRFPRKIQEVRIGLIWQIAFSIIICVQCKGCIPVIVFQPIIFAVCCLKFIDVSNKGVAFDGVFAYLTNLCPDKIGVDLVVVDLVAAGILDKHPDPILRNEIVLYNRIVDIVKKKSLSIHILVIGCQVIFLDEGLTGAHDHRAGNITRGCVAF